MRSVVEGILDAKTTHMNTVLTLLVLANTAAIIILAVRYSKFYLKVHKGFKDKENFQKEFAIALDEKFSKVKKVTDTLGDAILENEQDAKDILKFVKQSDEQLKEAIQDLIEDTDRRLKGIEKS